MVSEQKEAPTLLMEAITRALAGMSAEQRIDRRHQVLLCMTGARRTELRIALQRIYNGLLPAALMSYETAIIVVQAAVAMDAPAGRPNSTAVEYTAWALCASPLGVATAFINIAISTCGREIAGAIRRDGMAALELPVDVVAFIFAHSPELEDIAFATVDMPAPLAN